MKAASSVPVCNASELSETVFLGEFVSTSQPCVIKGAVRHWAATQKWRDRDYLKSLCGNRTIIYYPHENFVAEKRMEAGKRSMNFAEAMDILHSAETKVASLGFPDPLTELLQDIGGFSFLTTALPPILYDPHVRHFFYRNAGTTWHYHPFDETLMCQVIGSKKIGLVSAKTRCQKALHSVFFQEDYYDDASLLARFEHADLRWFSATLDEGDALYIPPLWWHGVVPLGPSFGVTTAVVWRSPSHVVADTIRKMDAGDIDLIGFVNLPEVRRLVAAAAELGMPLDIRRSAPLSISIRPALLG
ncbi:MAG TPA: cupin-like domain-containing protein [Rhizomicrobium sp.]|nr:cupin-like domain-containing protein [Rhizomicrobium sp.]